MSKCGLYKHVCSLRFFPTPRVYIIKVVPKGNHLKLDTHQISQFFSIGIFPHTACGLFGVFQYSHYYGASSGRGILQEVTELILTVPEQPDGGIIRTLREAT